MIRLPRLLATTIIADPQGRPTQAFHRYMQDFAESIERQVNDILAAQEAAAAAQATANAAQQDLALTNSFIDPASVLTSNPSAIFIASHTRHYGDGRVVSVNGATRTLPDGPDRTYYVSYSDPDKTGGSVNYQVTLAQPNQSGAVHVVGAIYVESSGPSTGGGGPGGVQP